MKAAVRQLLTRSGGVASVVSAITTPLTGTVAGSTSTTSLAIAIPVGYAAGDFCIINTYSGGTVTTPTGWTLSASPGVYYRVLDGSEASTVTFAQTTGFLTMCAQVFRNVNVTTQVEALATQKSTFSGTTVGCNSVSATANDTTAVTMCKMQVGSGTVTPTQPGGYTMVVSEVISLHSVGIATALGPLSSGGGIAPSWTASASVSSARGDVWLLKSA